MKAFHAARDRAATAAGASEKSAADARAAAEQAVRGARRTAGQVEGTAAADRRRGGAVRGVDTATAGGGGQRTSAAECARSGRPGDRRDARPASRRGRSVPGSCRHRHPGGVARRRRAEAGLQPNTIVAARAVSAQFPQIGEIDGVRPDSKPWHPSGLAIDIMIPNPSSPEGIALGDQILAFAMSNVGPVRVTGRDLAWHLLHAGRSAGIGLRPLRPRAHHHDAPLTQPARLRGASSTGRSPGPGRH